MNQTSNDYANRLASLDFASHAPEDIHGQPGISGYATGAGRSRANNPVSRPESECLPTVQAALNAFRQSIRLLDM
jgi:hypothetical protein